MKTNTYDVLIIGGGAAGLAAALYVARFRLATLVLAKEFGGTGNIAHQVDNWIGDPGIAGWDLMQKFINHVKSYDVPLVDADVADVQKKDSGFIVTTLGGDTYETRMVLFSNGMVHRKLGVPGEDEYRAKGVHYCYTCDGPLYKNKILAIVGGSDSAAQGSLFLAEYATQVYTIIRRDHLTAEPITAEKILGHKKIQLIPNTNVLEILGEGGRVTKLKLSNNTILPVDGLFIEIGHKPLSDLAQKLGVELDAKGFIKVNRKQETSVPGILAAGDITDATELKQFITSASEGSIAAQTAYHFLQ